MTVARPDPAAARRRDSHAVLAHAAAFVLGVVTLSVGAGLGPRHAAKEGLVAATVVGFVLLGAGTALAGWAAVGVLRRLRRRWWLLAVPLMLVTTYLFLWTVGQAVVADFPARPALGSRTPAEVGLEYRDVRFPAADGVTLAGWYLPSRNGAAVALLHGAGSTRSAVLDHAAVLARGGYGVLLFDARGHGESAGNGMEFGWYGEPDAEGAVNFLSTQADVTRDRVGLVGLSMGGEEAIGAAGRDDRVAAVVAEGATNRVSEDKGYLAEYGARGQVQRGIDWLTYSLTELLTDAPRPASLRDSVAAAAGRKDPTAFLLVTAGEVETESLAADYVRAVAPGSVQVWTVADAGHTAGLDVAPETWQRRVLSFLDDALG
jgi:pimeloyl-ACP methyl ester carboxylesterase